MRHDYNGITKIFLRELFDYDDSTGDLVWKVDRRGTAKKGCVAGTFPKSARYKKVRINGVPYQLHRLIWIYHNGNGYTETIDHIDRDKTNNRISNLRAVTQAENLSNVGIRPDNKSGYVGVFRSGRKIKPWRAQITVGGKKKYLGIFSNEKEAAFHVLAAEQCLDFTGSKKESSHRGSQR